MYNMNMKLKYHPYISKRERRYKKNLHETCFICYESDTNNLLTNICNCKSYIHDYCLAIVIINMGMRCRTCNEVYFSQKHNIKKRKTKIMKLLRLYYIEEVENKKSNWDRFDEFMSYIGNYIREFIITNSLGYITENNIDILLFVVLIISMVIIYNL
jgi:hypothetical protein